MISFFTSWLQSFTACLRNRHQHIILISNADISTKVNQCKVSPFAFALQYKLEQDRISSKIVSRTKADEKEGFDFSVAPLLRVLGKIMKNETASWKVILRLLAPKTMVVIDWDLSLNKACYVQNIKLFYLQHGVIAPDHMYFGKHTLKTLSKAELPYGFLGWDEVSIENFENLCKTFITGNQWNNGFLVDTFLHLYDNDKAAMLLYGFKKKVLLFTLTWGNHYDQFMPPEMIEIIKNAVNNFICIVRLHPVVFMQRESREDFLKFLQKTFTTEETENILWKEFNTLPLPLILKHTHIHITIESSVVIEAAQFGISSLILNDKVIRYGPNGENTPPYGGPSYFKQERDLVYAEVYHKDLDIKKWIKIQNKKNPLNNLEKNGSEWKRFTADINTVYSNRRN